MSEPGQKSVAGGQRRSFLQLMAMGLAGVGGAYYGVDKIVFDGTLTDSMLLAARDKKYREKLLQVIGNGRAPQKIKDEYFEKVIPYMRERSLGEKVNVSEQVLDKTFKKYEVRKLIEGDLQSEKYILIADLKPNVSIIKTESTDGGDDNLTMTQFREGPFITVPSASVSMGNPGDFFFYSAYKTDRGTVTYGENTKSICNGAVVLNNGSLQVVDRGDIDSYEVGKNCDAIQSYALAVNSKTLDADLESIASASILSADNPLQARKYECFMASFRSKTGEIVTKAVTSFKHLDEDTGLVSGDTWHITMSVEHAVGICNKIKEEGGYEGYVFVVPDPNYLHSRMNGPIVENSDTLIRTYSGNADPIIDEAELPIGFLPPYFLVMKGS